MFGQNFQRKYALTDQGVRNTKKGTFWTFLVNLIVMGGMGILYLLMYKLMGTLTEGRPLPSAPPLLGLVVLFVLLSFLTHLQQYKATYGLVYNEVKATRLSLAERLRKLPLGYFGKRDLGPDRDPHGRCEPHGARLVPCAGLSVRLLPLHGAHRGVPAGV